MPIPQETVVSETVPAADSTDLPKIKEKALPTADSTKPAAAEEKKVEEGKGEKALPTADSTKPAAEEEKKVEEAKGEKAGEESAAVAAPADSKKETPAEAKKEIPEEGEPKPTTGADAKVEEAAKKPPTASSVAATSGNKTEENGKTPKEAPAEEKRDEEAVEKAANGLKEAEKDGKEEVGDGSKTGDKEADKVEEKKEKKEAETSTPAASTTKEAPTTPAKAGGDVMASSTESPDLTPKKAEAFNLLAQGKRHYLVKDYESAVETLGEVCEKFSALYGETGTEMGDVYYYYGISLLELAREEAHLLNVDKEDKKEGEDEEEEDEDAEEEMEEDEEEGKGSGKKMPKDDEEKASSEDAAAKPAADSTADSNTTKDSAADSSVAADSTADSSVAADDTLKEGETTMEEEDEVNNLQLAWEMLELARSIYYRVKNELKLADIYLKLSEVSMESENYAAAIEDIEKGLAIYSVELAKDARPIAEAYYKLGMAHANNDNYPEAVKHFQLSRETLLSRVENLKRSTKPDAEISKEPFYKKENEIKELEALLPEMNARIEECSSDNKEIQKVISKFIAGGRRPAPAGSEDGAGPSSAPDAASSSASATPSKPASDISHLVKKKRKPEDDADRATEVEGKKIKLDETSANKEQTLSSAAVDDVEMTESAVTDASAEKKTEDENKSAAAAPSAAD